MSGPRRKSYTFAQLVSALYLGYARLTHPSDYSKREYDLTHWACRHGKHQRETQVCRGYTR